MMARQSTHIGSKFDLKILYLAKMKFSQNEVLATIFYNIHCTKNEVFH